MGADNAPHVRVADDALAIALLAEAADGDARLLAAHDQVGVVLGHGGGWCAVERTLLSREATVTWRCPENSDRPFPVDQQPFFSSAPRSPTSRRARKILKSQS